MMIVSDPSTIVVPAPFTPTVTSTIGISPSFDSDGIIIIVSEATAGGIVMVASPVTVTAETIAAELVAVITTAVDVVAWTAYDDNDESAVVITCKVVS